MNQLDTKNISGFRMYSASFININQSSAVLDYLKRLLFSDWSDEI